MRQNNSGTLRLNEIQNLIQVSEGKALQLMETCIWCLMYCNHPNGVIVKVVDSNTVNIYSITWPDDRINFETVQRSYNKDDATEYGAEAIAFLILVERTEYTAVERASTTTGIDYWLGHKIRNQNEPFHRAGRLEISGIMAESPGNTVSSRVQTKLKQTLPTDHTFPVYVVVVEFSQPYATMVLKNANR